MSSRHKKRKLKKFPKIVLSFLLVCAIGGGLFLYLNNEKKDTTKSEPKKTVKKEEKKAVDYEAKIFMVGDALIHWGVYNDALQSDGSYDFKPQLEYIKPIASKYDLAYYNQETVLGGTELGVSSYPRFNTPQEEGDAFGFTCN